MGGGGGRREEQLTPGEQGRHLEGWAGVRWVQCRPALQVPAGAAGLSRQPVRACVLTGGVKEPEEGRHGVR